ncbi:MAG: DUF6659 family protein [Nitrosopumilaceae archaeon]|nr:DUF6659 family protein [Nitrosopumilaceae archaeon]
MESQLIFSYDYACYQIHKIEGVRFAGIINNRGRKIAGGFRHDILPLEKDEKKLEMLFMELSLDLSMRQEFNESLGEIKGIVSYRDKVNIITIPFGKNFVLLSTEQIEPINIIQKTKEILEGMDSPRVSAC